MAKDNTAAQAPTPEPVTGGENEAGDAIAAALGQPVAEPTATAAAAATVPGTTTTPPKEEPTTPDASATPGANEPEEQPRGQAAVDVEGYEKMRRDALAPPATEKPEQSVSSAATEGAVPSLSDDLPAVESTDAPPKLLPEPESEAKVPDRIRVGRLKSDADKKRIATATQLAADEGIDFDEAWTRVTGKKSAAADAIEPGSMVGDAAPVPRSRSEIDADIQAKKSEKRQAASDLDTLKMLDLDEEIESLRGELGHLEKTESEAASRAAVQFERDVSEAEVKALAFYPEAGQTGTALHQKIIEIADRLENSENPLVYQAEAPLKIAQMAANELGIAPADPNRKATPANGASNPSTSTAATHPQSVRQVAASRSMQPAVAPASGADRTTHGNGSTPVALKKIRSVHDYEELKESLGLRV